MRMFFQYILALPRDNNFRITAFKSTQQCKINDNAHLRKQKWKLHSM